MTASALVTGALFRAPEHKISKGGKPYAVATIKTRADENRSEFWRVTVFSETAIDALMTLGEGDALSVQGAMKAELYTPEGKEPRISMSIIADAVQPLRASRKKDATKGDSDDRAPIRRSRAAQAANGGGREMPQLRHHGGSGFDPRLDDDIPF